MEKTIQQFANDANISVKKIRQLQRLGVIFPPMREADEIEKMILAMQRGQDIPVKYCIQLLRNPELLLELGEHDWLAKMQVAKLGDIAAQALPAGSHNLIINAALKSPEAVEKLAGWIASIIPANGCDYAWIAARALLNIETLYLDLTARHTPRAIFQARKSPELAGMSAVIGRRTQFFPRKKEFDL